MARLTRGEARVLITHAAAVMGAGDSVRGAASMNVAHNALWVTQKAAGSIGLSGISDTHLRRWSFVVADAYRVAYDSK